MPKFQTGEVHNPHGRPRGTGYRQQIFNNLVMPHKKDLIEKAISMALEGDPQMLKLFLDRILPPKPSDEPISLDLPSDKLTIESIIEVGNGVLRSLGNGNITPEQARSVFDVIKGYRENIVFEGLLKKIEGLEATFKSLNEVPFDNVSRVI